MNDIPEQLPDDADSQFPPGLARDLSRLYSTGAKPSSAVDATIRLAAAAHFHQHFARRRMARRVLRWGSAVAAAAAIALAVIRLGPWTHNAPVPSHFAIHAAVDKYDLNGDGKVDILDAFYLARQLKMGKPLDPAWDVNGDGVIDQRDVDAIAARAVSLERGGVQ